MRSAGTTFPAPNAKERELTGKQAIMSAKRHLTVIKIKVSGSLVGHDCQLYYILTPFHLSSRVSPMPRGFASGQSSIFRNLKRLRCRALNALLPHGHIFVEAPLCVLYYSSHMGTVSVVMVAMETHTFRPLEVWRH